MIYVPKRKRRLKQFSKLFLYSSTLLAVAGSYSSPIVTVLADKEISSNFENDSKTNDQKQNVASSTNKNQPQQLNLSSKNNNQEQQINPRASKTYQIHLVIIKTPDTTQVDAPASDQNLTLTTSKQAGEDITSEIDQILNQELPGKYIRAHLESLSNTVTVPDSGSEIKVYVVLQKQTINFIGANEAGQQLYFDDAQTQPITFSKYMTVGDKILEGTKLNDLTNHTGANHFRLKGGFQCTNRVISNPDNHKIILEKDHQEILEFVDFDTYDTVSSISVWGWPNDTINITNLIPNGYELVNPSNSTFTFHSAQGQTSQIVIKKQLNLNVTNPVEFIDTDDANKVIASGQSISGIKGEPITKDKIDPILEAKLGNDYQFINNTFPTVNYGDDGESVQFKVEKKSIDNTIIYQDHGVEISRKNVNGKIGKEISNTTILNNLPTSTSHHPWELVNPTISFNFDSIHSTHNVAITRKYTNKIKFCYNNNPILDNNGQPIIQNISGYADDPILSNQINQSLIPVNYQLPNTFPNLKIINLDDSVLTLNLELKPITSIVNYLNYVDENDYPVGPQDTIQITGQEGDAINEHSLITNNPDPAHYELDPSKSQPSLIGPNNNKLKVILRGKEKKYKFIYQDEAGNQIANVENIDGRYNNSATNQIKTHIPSGYNLVNEDVINNLKFGDDNEIVILIKAPTTPITTHNYLNYVDENDHPVGPQDTIQITGQEGDAINEHSLITNNPDPAHYELDPSKSQPSLIGPNNNKLKVILRGKEKKYKFIYQDEAGNQIANVENIDGRYNNSATNQIKTHIPSGYNLVNEDVINNLKFGDDNEIVILIKAPTTPITTHNYLNYVDENDHPVGPQDTIQITGQVGDAINELSLIRNNPDPTHYELDPSKSQPSLIGNNDSKLKVHLRGREYKYQLIYQQTATEVYRVNNVSGRYGHLVGNLITQNLPSNYTLVNSNLVNTLKFGSNSKIIIPVNTAFLPNDPGNQPIRNYLQFTLDELYFGDKITIWGDYGNIIDLKKYLPTGYELKDPNNLDDRFKIAETIHYIPIKKIAIPKPELPYNFFQFIVNDKNFGDQIKVNGTPGSIFDLRNILPNDYELSSEINPLFTLGTSGTVNYIPIEKITKPQSNIITNYVQFILDGVIFNSKEKVTGKLNDVINYQSLVPKGYELEYPQQIIKIAAEGTIHKLPIKKIQSPVVNPEINYVQFIVNGDKLGNRITVKGFLGDIIDLKVLIPKGYELAQSNETLSFGLSGTTHFVNLQKVVSPMPQTVNNYLQFTLNGKNYGIAIKRTGKIGEIIQINPWIPQGYHLKITKPIMFDSEGKVHYLALVKNSSKNLITNYLQFTIFGQKLGDPIKIKGYLNDEIQIQKLVPKGFVLFDPQIKVKIKPDQNLQQIPLKVLTNLTHSPKINYHKHHLHANTGSKHNSLPQLGEKKSKTLSLGLISLSSASATAAWLSRRKKKEN